MCRYSKSILLVFALMFLGNDIAFGNTNEDSNTGEYKFSLEVDPSTFVFGGYSAHLRFKPAFSDNLLFGAGIYAMDLPSIMVDINEKNKDKGWDVRINTGIGIFGEYHFSQVNDGFFAGLQTSLQEYKIENEAADNSGYYTNALFMGYGGYTLNFSGIPVYFKFWGGIGYTDKIDGTNVVDNLEYDIAPVTFFGTFHIGYTF
jgi:hypothetical protein